MKTTPPASPPADLMSELLQGMRLSGIHYHRIRVMQPFGLAFGTSGVQAHFHFVAAGAAFLRGATGEITPLAAGAAVFLPHGGAHQILSDPEVACREITTFDAALLCSGVRDVGCGAAQSRATLDEQGGAVLFSGCMDFELGGMQSLVRMMPEVMRVDGLEARHPELLPILTAMEQEACSQRVGFAGILARLADVVSALIVRGWVECGCGGAAGLVEALRDPRLARAIAAVHREPGRDWTVADLASEMGSSRSVFAERFQAVTGVSPLRYVAELRMRLAKQWIGRDGMPIDTVAHQLGYASQAAFSRAFKRVTGYSPGSGQWAPVAESADRAWSS